MKNTSLLRRVLSVVLTVALLFTLLVPAASAVKSNDNVEELKLTPVDPGTLENQKLGETEADSSIEQEAHALTDVVRVSIVLEKASTLDAGFSTEGIANNAAAVAYREGLRADQAALTAKIEKAIGNKLDVQWNLTLAANNISANVLYGQINAIKAVPGVKDVFLENRYEPEAAVDEDEPNNGSASYMTGANIAWANGYTGAGSKVAVIDTGADIDHQSFSGEGLEYALAKNAEEKGMPYDEYVESLNLLTPEFIDSVKGQLNANIGSGAAVYRNTKVGYGYNYVDKNATNITHMTDSQGEHGSHVSGISTANRFVKIDGEFQPALSAVGTQGVAPDAQLVVMKVFGSGGGAYDSDYMVAIEDAIVLGCDSANLSLGSGSCGFSFSGGYEDVMNKLVENGLVVAISAGNSYGWYDTPYNEAMYPYLYAEDMNYATNGSPGSFTNSLTVASVDNLGQTGMPLIVGDLHVFYSETSGYGNNPIATIAGNEYEYVYFDNFGADGDGNSLLTPYADAIAGKIVFCSRGTSSFFQKVNAAAEAGAVACVIYNNQAGVINMNLSGVTTNIPAVSITQADGLAIKAQSEAVEAADGTTYYTGTLSIAKELEVQVPEVTDTVTVSSFSSWGGPGSMVLKPEILAPGGSIYSVWGANVGQSSPTQSHTDYEVMSGTSMASPQVAGMAAVMGQYIRENELCEKTGLSARQLTNSLLMSTAHPVFDADGNYWPVIRVGAGLGNVADATAAQSYILMDEEATMFPDSAMDGKVKAELGDDPDYTGEYEYSFTLYPMEGSKEFTLRTDIFTQWLAGNGGYGMLQDQGTVLLASETTYEINGETIGEVFEVEADVNMDGVTDEADAQAILDHITGEEAEGAAFDAEVADVDGDGAITTFDAKLILDSCGSEAVTIDEPTKVTVHIKIDEADKEFLLGYFTKGFYVEGYTYVEPVATREGAMDVVHSIPIYGFCGGWTDPAMLDRTTVIDEAYGTGKLPYLANTNTNYLSLKNADGETSVYMGNPYMVEDEFPAEKLAMNSNDTVQAYNYINIRNAATMGFAVLDEDGKVLFAQATPGQFFAPYYYVNGGAWQQYNPRSFNVGKKLASAGLKEDDKVSVGFYALPEYYGVQYAKMNGEVATTGGLDSEGFKAMLEAGLIGEGAGIKYDVTIDDTDPVVIGALKDLITGDIYVKCSDNRYVAYVAIMNKSGSKVFFETVPEQTEPGEELEVPLNLEGISLPKDVTLFVGDYAGNEVAFKVDLGGGDEGGNDLGGTMLGFVGARSTTGVGSGDRVWEINPDEVSCDTSGGNLTGVGLFANINVTVTAAEYVDGYIFMAGNDGAFYVADVNAMDEVMMVGKYSDTVGTILDMAFNYRDKQLYVLGNNNKLYTMDLVTGALTEVARLAAADSASANFNALAIDDDGNFYTATNGSTSSAKLYKFTLDNLEMVEIPVFDNGWFFNSSAELNGWTMLDRDGDGNTFAYNSSAAQEGAGGIGSRWNSSANVDDWAISPAIDLTEYENAELSFWVRKSSATWTENYDVYVGTTKNPDEMVEVLPQTPADSVWTNVKVDLADYLGEEEIYVAIRHDGGRDQYYLYVDAVQIQGDKISDEPVEPQYEGVITAAPVGTSYLGFYNYSNGGGFAWDHNKGILYAVSNYSSTGDYDHYLWIVDTETGVAARANTVGTGSGYSNISGRLYANVCGLIVIPGTSAIITPTDEATDLIVEPEEINLLVGQSSEPIQAYVLPWTLTDKDVTMESNDESIATVKDGVVTGVAVGSTTITVTTVAEPHLTKDVTVNVEEAPAAEIRGIIWDENGKGQASVFSSDATNDWEALSVVGQLRWGARVNDMVYGSTEDTMFGFDADTYEVETYGGIVSMWIPSDADALPQDLRDAFAEMGYNVGPVIGPNNNGTYLTLLDPEAGSLIYFDLSDDDFGTDPMATITFAGRTSYNGDDNAAAYYVMSESGKLFLFSMDHEGYLTWDELGETGIDLTGVSDATNQIWASMVYDPENDFLYLSHYDGVGDLAYLYAIDPNDPARNGQVGDFNESVWPVVGLYQYEPATDLSLSVEPTDIVLFEGDTAEVKIKVKLGETNEYTAEIADPAIASFEDGVVTGLKEGETTLTVTTVDSNAEGEHLSETVNIKVKGLKAIEAFIGAQVSDAKGVRFTKISLDGPVASSKGFDAPGDVTSGARAGDIYIAGVGTTPYVLDAETFEATDSWNGIDAYYSQYPAMDIANYPNHIDSEGAVDNHKALFTTSIGWLVYPDYYGWNLSSYFPTMSGLCFAGTDVNDDDETIYVYYMLTAEGMLYELDVTPEAGSLNYAELLDTGLTFEQGEISMAWITNAGLHGDWEIDVSDQGIVVADNTTKVLYYIDFTAENAEDVVCKIGTLDADNVSGLYGTFDDMVSLNGAEPEPPTPPTPVYDGDLIQGFYFESEDEVNEWTVVDADGDGYNWTWNQNVASWFDGTPDFNSWASEGTGCMASASYINTVGVLNPDNWMVYGPIDLSEAADDAIVSLKAKGLDPSYASEKFAIYAGTSADVDSMTQISSVQTATGEYAQYYGALADFIGEDEVYIAIRHWDISDMYILLVDEVEVLHNLTEEVPDDPDPIGGDSAYAWDFESDPAAAGWTFVDSDNDGYNWYWHVNTGTGNHTTHSGDGIIASESYNNDTSAVLTPDNWAISPAFDLSEAASAGLSIWAMGQDSSYAAEKFQLYAGTSADVSEMQAVSSLFTATGAYVNYTADLSDFAGEDTVYVAIRHYNVSDMFILNVDDVEILVTAAEGGDALKNVPAKTYEAVPMNYTRKPLADGTGVASIAAAADVSGVAELSRFGEQTQAVGGTNAIKAEVRKSDLRKPIDETVVENGNVQIALSDDVATTNGLFTVTYNADELTYVDAISGLPYKSIHHEIFEPAEGEEPALRTGVITFAYASKDEIPAEEVLATLNFTYEGEINTTVVVTPLERNDQFAIEDEELVIEIKDEEACKITHFEDVMETYPDHDCPEHKAIEWAYVNGYTAGIDETHFGVGKSLTRAETATFFWTISGKPEINEADFENPFSDVKPGKWYTKYILWAFSEGLVSGYEDGTYRPNNELNRGEILTLLYAFDGKPSIEGIENPFSDVKPGKWYEAPALWAYDMGIECGDDGLFNRNTVVSRETFVLYLYRYMEKDCLDEP